MNELRIVPQPPPVPAHHPPPAAVAVPQDLRLGGAAHLPGPAAAQRQDRVNPSSRRPDCSGLLSSCCFIPCALLPPFPRSRLPLFAPNTATPALCKPHSQPFQQPVSVAARAWLPNPCHRSCPPSPGPSARQRTVPTCHKGTAESQNRGFQPLGSVVAAATQGLPCDSAPRPGRGRGAAPWGPPGTRSA